MNLRWNVAVENDPTNGNVGAVIIAATDSVVVKDLLPPAVARQLAAALLQAAEEVAPTPPTESAPADEPSPAPVVARKPIEVGIPPQ